MPRWRRYYRALPLFATLPQILMLAVAASYWTSGGLSAGGRAVPHRADLRDPGHAQELVEAALAAFGRLDGVVLVLLPQSPGRALDSLDGDRAEPLGHGLVEFQSIAHEDRAPRPWGPINRAARRSPRRLPGGGAEAVWAIHWASRLSGWDEGDLRPLLVYPVIDGED